MLISNWCVRKLIGLEGINELNEKIKNGGDESFVLFDTEHECIEEIIELFFDKPELDAQTDNMVEEVEWVRFILVEVFGDWVEEQGVVSVVAFL